MPKQIVIDEIIFCNCVVIPMTNIVFLLPGVDYAPIVSPVALQIINVRKSDDLGIKVELMDYRLMNVVIFLWIVDEWKPCKIFEVNMCMGLANISKYPLNNSWIWYDNANHDDVIKWKYFLRYWPFVRGFHRSSVNSPQKRPLTRSFDIFFDLRLNKRLSKQWWGRWFEALPRPLCRHCNGMCPDKAGTRRYSTSHPPMRKVCGIYCWHF